MATTIQEVNMIQALSFADYVHGLDFQVQSVFVDGLPIGWNSGSQTLDNLSWLSGDPKPTEQQIVDWYNDSEAEQTAQDQLRQDIDTAIGSFPLSRSDGLLALQLLADTTRAFLNENNPDVGTVYAGFVSRLTGTALQTPLTDYVQMIDSSITDFTPANITDLQKSRIVEIAQSFLLTSLLISLADIT